MLKVIAIGKLCKFNPKQKPFTVGENIIATTKIRNNYGVIQTFKFPIVIAILDFSLLLLVKSSLLILYTSFLVSVLCFFFDGFLSKVIASNYRNSDRSRS